VATYHYICEAIAHGTARSLTGLTIQQTDLITVLPRPLRSKSAELRGTGRGLREAGHGFSRLAVPLAMAGVFLGLNHLQGQTVFALPTTFGNYATGSVTVGNVAAAGGSAVYSDPGFLANGLRAVTFGQSFTIATDGTQPGGTGAWAYQGNITGSSIGAGVSMPISYNFTLQNNGNITSTVDWVLYFRGGTNAELQVASGTMSAPTPGVPFSTTFSGNAASYIFTSGATAGTDTYRAYIGLSFTNNLGALQQGVLTVSMVDGGFQGPGITLNASAIPEPSTYAAMAGSAMLGFAVWRRRRIAGLESAS
jgi:hypothetical protein